MEYHLRVPCSYFGCYEDGPENYYEYLSYMMYYPLTVAMLLLNFFGEGTPKIYPYGKVGNPSPEPLASFPSQKLITYFESFMYKGYRNPLETKDLWDLEPQNRASNMVLIFEEKFAKRLEKSKKAYEAKNQSQKATKKRSDTSILIPLWCCVWRLFTGGLFVRLITDIIQFANPKLLGLVINFIGSDEPLWKGFFYALIMFLVAACMTFTNTTQMNWFFKVGQQSRSILTAAIYRKSLRISNAARKDKTVGEIVNLMSADAQKFQEVVMFINFLWSAPISIIFALFFLYQEVGKAAFAGMAIMLLLIPINYFIVRKSRELQVKQMKLKDERVKVMNEVLNGIKVLKLYAWEKSFEQHITKIRSKEVATLRKATYLNAISQFIWNTTPFLVSCVTFSVFVIIDENNLLDPSKAFVTLALINLIRMPMGMLPGVITQVVQTWVSIRRINSFLNAEELQPYVTHQESNEPIIIENGTFTWGNDPILKNINLSVGKHSLTAVVGAVGSGKSSLISAILGEMDKISGSINTWGSVAYVPQQAWIQNATVQDNITFGEVFDKLKYQTIIEACALKPDFDMLANGDQTEIGEKGINLSGGQKQRISLARAVYADADVYLLDDPLSAVDSHVGKQIFNNLIGPNGLLKNKTRILVTHAITYLPQTNKIVVLTDGEITEIGQYEELLSKKGAFADFILQHITEQVEDPEELDEIEEQLANIPIAQELTRTISRQISRQRSRISESGSQGSQYELNGFSRTESRESLRSNKSFQRTGSLSQRRHSNARRGSVKAAEKVGKDFPMKTIQKKPEKGQLISEERTEKGNVKLDVYKYYLISIGKHFIGGTIFFCITFQVFNIASTMWLGEWSEDPNIIVDGHTNKKLQDMYMIVYAMLGVGLGLSVLFSTAIFAKGSMAAAKKLHNFMLANVLRLPMSFFDTTPSGRILSRFSGDIIGIDLRLPMALNVFFQNSFRVLATVAVICYATPPFIGVIIPLFALYIFIQRYYVATSRQLRRIDAVSRSPIYSHFGETLSGTHVIRAYGHVQRFSEHSEEQIDFNQKSIYPTNSASLWLTVRLETIANLIIFFATLFAILAKNLNPALVGLSISYSMNITNSLNFLVRMISEVETTIISVERIKEYGETKQEAPWEIPEKKPADIWPEVGLVQFKELAVKYRPELDLVLKGISFEINGGEKVGIVGRTGAGKSSLTLALFRIIEAVQGKIIIDGKDISEIGVYDLRSRLTIIPQDAVLFSGSLRMNLDPFDHYSDDDIWRSLEHAHLKQFVLELAGGLNHKVAEGGDNLSVGQRQLICLARALLRKSRILILDEATAAIDLETDDLIQKTIRSSFKDCTVLTIAHRLNTIIDSDRVLVLDKGKIAEFDSPETLLNNKNSIFFGMCKDAGLTH
ncbi:hypothetical protein ABEB36_009120 [Hypothenemus hampei]|uniref:ABC-type glutathione-S-conjugate transporter n=1 Tax=Hypothenemus hampei TaxID=57062 RepID=A0ABD1EP90_HYPHA